MDPVTLILIVLVVLILFGGFGLGGGAYRNHGISLAGLLVVILVVYLLFAAT